MSYLDVPRIHFAGEFFADPSTVNNKDTNYSAAAPATVCDPAATTARPGYCWNYTGFHWFTIQNCKVTLALDDKGTLLKTSADDPVVGASVATDATDGVAKLADLDPGFQTYSQIWGAKLKIEIIGTENFVADMLTATLRDIWRARSPKETLPNVAPPNANYHPEGFSGCYQSELVRIKWDPTAKGTSKLLSKFRPMKKLSIKFVLYSYHGMKTSPKWRNGKIVGSIGPVGAKDTFGTLGLRRLEPNPASPGRIYSTPVGPAPFRLDEKRKVLILDLGNAIPEDAPGGARLAMGTMQAKVTPTGASTATVLGPIDYSQSHYETTAGVEEIPLTAAQITAVKAAPVSITVKPSATEIVILSERTDGSNLEAEQVAIRLNSGETTTIGLIATEFGAPKANQVVDAVTLSPTGARAAPLTTSMLATKTGADGRIVLKLKATNPGSPRAPIDGDLFRVGITWGAAAAVNARGVIAVRIFEDRAMVASPAWADVKDILEQYAKMFPGMVAFLNLASQAAIKARIPDMVKTLSYPDTHAKYMPATRDLSRDKKALLLKWLNKGAP